MAKKGVTVNTISPGYIGTKMVMAIPKEVLDSKILPQIPVGRLGKPEEIAGLIIYLCSDEAAFVTGANIAINGGQHIKYLTHAPPKVRACRQSLSSSLRSTHSAASVPAAPESKYRLT